jgi:hypothetical protein
MGLWKLLNAPQSLLFGERERMDRPPEGGAKRREDRVKPPARPGPWCPALQNRQSWGGLFCRCAGEKHYLKMGQPPDLPQALKRVQLLTS